MLIRVFDVLDRNRKIQCIKIIRQATGFGLRESKDFVDRLYEGRVREGVEVRIKDDLTDAEFDEFGEWFEWEQLDGEAPKGTLKLFRVIYTDSGNSYTAVVLATTKPRADAAARKELTTFWDVEPSPTMVTTIDKVTSFRNGQVLLMSRL